MAGVGPSMVFAVTDAIFEPLAAHQVVQARTAALQTVTNDTILFVAEAYFNVQQARGELVGAEEATRRAAEVFRRRVSGLTGQGQWPIRFRITPSICSGKRRGSCLHTYTRWLYIYASAAAHCSRAFALFGKVYEVSKTQCDSRTDRPFSRGQSG